MTLLEVICSSGSALPVLALPSRQRDQCGGAALLGRPSSTPGLYPSVSSTLLNLHNTNTFWRQNYGGGDDDKTISRKVETLQALSFDTAPPVGSHEARAGFASAETVIIMRLSNILWFSLSSVKTKLASQSYHRGTEQTEGDKETLQMYREDNYKNAARYFPVLAP